LVLVFTRKRDEAIMIGDGIEIRVLRVGRDGVRLGVSAPAAIAVHRREIYDQICEENRSAAGTAAAAHLLIERLRKIAGQSQPAPTVLDAERPAVGS
jgi:carbon storage regulator